MGINKMASQPPHPNGIPPPMMPGPGFGMPMPGSGPQMNCPPGYMQGMEQGFPPPMNPSSIPTPGMPNAKSYTGSGDKSRATSDTRSAWGEHKAPDGRIYYYNSLTKESSWEKPEDLKSAQEKLLSNCPWKEFKSDGGKVYFHNSVTKESRWTKPKELIDLEAMISASNPAESSSTPPPKPEPTSAIEQAMQATLASIALP